MAEFLESMRYTNFTKQYEYARHGYIYSIKFQLPENYPEEENIL